MWNNFSTLERVSEGGSWNGKSGAETVFVYATKSQRATRESQRYAKCYNWWLFLSISFSYQWYPARKCFGASVVCPLCKRHHIGAYCADSSVTIKMFADDTKSYTVIVDDSSVANLQSSLDRIHRWSNHWQLKLSLSLWPLACLLSRLVYINLL